MSFYAIYKNYVRSMMIKVNGRLKKGWRMKRVKIYHRFHRNMKVIPRSQRLPGINCNKNGVAL